MKLSEDHKSFHKLLGKDSIYCWFNEKHSKHTFTSDNGQINLLIDLILNLGFSLDNNLDQIKKPIKTIAALISEKNKILKEIQENLEAIRKTQNVIFKSYNEKLLELPKREEIQQIVYQLERKPKLLETEVVGLINQVKQLVLETRQQFQQEIAEIKQTLQEIKTQ